MGGASSNVSSSQRPKPALEVCMWSSPRPARAHAFYRRVGFEELELPGHFGRRLDRRS